MFNSKKVLVTGSGGQLGRTLQKNCSDKNSFEWIFLPKEKLAISDGLSLEKSGTQSIPLLLTFMFPLKKYLSFI